MELFGGIMLLVIIIVLCPTLILTMTIESKNNRKK